MSSLLFEQAHLDLNRRYCRFLLPVRRLIDEQFPVGGRFGNAIAECFIAMLECEFVDRHLLHIRSGARMAIFEFTIGCHNPKRRRSTLCCLSFSIVGQRSITAGQPLRVGILEGCPMTR